jgi:hypothetical protein
MTAGSANSSTVFRQHSPNTCVNLAAWNDDQPSHAGVKLNSVEPSLATLLDRVQTLRIHMLQMSAYSALAIPLSAADPKPLLCATERYARRLRRERQALVANADAWMASQGIRNPTGMAAVFAPGFGP